MRADPTKRRRHRSRPLRGHRRGRSYATEWAGRSIGAPAPPSGSSLLFDYDPAHDHLADRMGAELTSSVGTPALVTANGLKALELDGSSYLVFESPIAALSDVGDLSVYCVCERTDANADQRFPVQIDASASGSGEDVIYLGWNPTDSAVAGMSGAPTAIVFDTESGATRNAVEVLSLHLTTTSLTARRGGTGTSSGVAATDPSSLDRLLIGASAIFGAPSASWIGRIYRILIYDAAYDANVTDGL